MLVRAGEFAHLQRTASGRLSGRHARTRREMNVFLQGAPQPVLFTGIDFGECHEIAVKHILGFGTQHISEAAGHARTEIQAERPENDGHAAGHVLASVLADTFHYGKRATVADSETLPAAAGNKKLAGRRALQHGVAGKNVTAPGSSKPRGAGHGPAGESFADVVVGFALELERNSLGKKSAEALTGGPMKFLANFSMDGVPALAARR